MAAVPVEAHAVASHCAGIPCGLQGDAASMFRMAYAFLAVGTDRSGMLDHPAGRAALTETSRLISPVRRHVSISPGVHTRPSTSELAFSKIFPCDLGSKVKSIRHVHHDR